MQLSEQGSTTPRAPYGMQAMQAPPLKHICIAQLLYNRAEAHGVKQRGLGRGSSGFPIASREGAARRRDQGAD
jgi:hypothetical protein